MNVDGIVVPIEWNLDFSPVILKSESMLLKQQKLKLLKWGSKLYKI